MRKSTLTLLVPAILAWLPLAGAQTLSKSVLYNFAGPPSDGEHPHSNLMFNSSGMLYGTTYGGGSHGYGIVYQLSPPVTVTDSAINGWTETVLYNFGGGSDGANPNVDVVMDSNGVLYGTTYLGGSSGAGTVYSLTPPATTDGKITTKGWTETILHTFTGGADGGTPAAGVIIGPGGVLYGTTYFGGTGNVGTVYSLTPPPTPGGAWVHTVLYTFTASTGGGAYPNASVLLGTHGGLFGTTYGGGTSKAGVVFELVPPSASGGAWTEILLHTFASGSTDGEAPVAGLTGVAAGCSMEPSMPEDLQMAPRHTR